jgi:hypothetical protein
MSKPWFKKYPGRYTQEKEQVKRKYPELSFSEKSPNIVVHGAFPVLGESGEVLDRYQIRIRVPPDFPNEISAVYETGGDIPRSRDRHIENDEGKCCLEIEEEFWIRHGQGYNLTEFLDGPVRSFFADQSYFDEEGIWPHGQRSHGAEGIFEAYEELLGTGDRGVICRWVHLLAQEEVPPQYDCPCGSDSPIDQCHLDLLIQLRDRIPPPTAQRSLNRLASHSDFSLVW